jgi:hypothetical protein
MYASSFPLKKSSLATIHPERSAIFHCVITGVE